MSILFKPKTKGLKLYASTVLSLLLANCSPSYATATPKQGFYNNYYDYVMSNYSNNHNKKPLSVLYITDNKPYFTYLTASKSKGLFILTLGAVAVTGNNEVLSKSTSVTTPQRHCGFFAPVIYSASQAIKCSAKMKTAHLRPKSVYDWTTRPNKPMANKSGGSSRPRVNPVALISQFSVTSHNSKLLGVAHHG